MSATMPQQHQPDPAVPMTEPWGARFPSAVEAEAFTPADVEQVHNLGALERAFFSLQDPPEWSKTIPPMTPDQFAGLVHFASYARVHGEQLIDWADEIETWAHAFYRRAMDANVWGTSA